jgi:hypothetical protein
MVPGQHTGIATAQLRDCGNVVGRGEAASRKN